MLFRFLNGGFALADLSVVLSATLFATSLWGAGSVPTTAPGNSLAERDAKYDPVIKGIWGKTSNNGYHTRFKPGSPAHSTRESLNYALDLIATNEPARIARAEEILRAVYALQITDPTDAAFGIWPWLMEEPVAQMNPPDWNWADFCGAIIAVMLNRYEDRLSPELRVMSRSALRNAAWSIFRRNVQPSYTNIAVMGGGVVVAAGEVLGEPALVDYGRRRLQNCVTEFDRTGGFNEYNSPAYTTIVLTETERALDLVKDPATRKAAEDLRQRAWTTIAESFHPGTGQWSGPHSRAYSDTLNAGWARFLSEKSGATVIIEPGSGGGGPSDDLSYHDCPPELQERFKRLPSSDYEIHRRFIRRADDSLSTTGTTWFSENATLGSVNYDTFWIQRRPLIGYWRTDEDPAVVLKLQMLRDGKDFASGVVRTTQSKNTALSLITLVTNKGSHHDHIDIPKDGIFPSSSLKARLELAGKGVKIQKVADGVYDLIAGTSSARVVTGPGRFNGRDVTIETGQDDNCVFVDVVFYSGPEAPLKFADLTEAFATIALTITTGPQQPASLIVVSADADNQLTATSGSLKVAGPSKPVRHPF